MRFFDWRKALQTEIFDPRLSRALEDVIPRYQRSYATMLPADLERRFERDTQDIRLRHLNFTLLLGSICYLATGLTDFVLLPDIGYEGIILRLAGLPFWLAAVLIAPRLRPLQRERLILAAGVFLVAVLATIPLLSSAPQAPLAFVSAILGFTFGNTTVVPRFRYGCIFTAISCAMIIGLSIWQSPLGWAITVQVLLAAAFSLIANYRIERGERLAYLLRIREAQRNAALAAEREKLRALNDLDELTRLANRGAFNRYCAAILSEGAFSGRTIAMLLIDVDHFKEYNDHYGHMAGDDCLRVIAERIAGTIRSSGDFVARFGGEEFIGCVLDVTPGQAELLAERICEGVRALDIEHAGRTDGPDQVTVSVGIATATISTGSSIDALIEAADRALYAAKRKGRNRIEIALADAA